MEQYDNNEKVDQRGLKEVLSFCIEVRNDVMMDNVSMHKIDIIKDKIKEYKER